MRLTILTGLAAAGVLLVGAAGVADSKRPDPGAAESRHPSSFVERSPGPLAVRSPVVRFRIPSLLAVGTGAEPRWITEMARDGGVGVPLRPLAPTVAPVTSDPGSTAGAADRLDRLRQEELLAPYEFYFTRAAYTGSRGWGWRGGRSQAWATDFPKADQQFMVVLRRLTNLDAYPDQNAVLLDDPRIRRFPFLYALEVGYMNLRDEEIAGLRDYLDAGGFLMIDDFWGVREWSNFEYHMSRVLPGRPIQEIPEDHPLFDMVYDISEVLQVPALGRGIYGRPTWEGNDARVPTVSGIFDDDGRLMVVINWNTDLGDAWEHAENPMYPVEYSTYAFQVGVNTIVYGMSH